MPVIGVRWRDVAQAFVVAAMVLVVNEGLEHLFQSAGCLLRKQAALCVHYGVPTLQLGVRLRMAGRSRHMADAQRVLIDKQKLVAE